MAILTITLLITILTIQDGVSSSLDKVCKNGGTLTVLFSNHVPYISLSNKHYPFVSGLFPDILDKMVNSCCHGDVNLTYHEITNTGEFYAKVKDLRLNKFLIPCFVAEIITFSFTQGYWSTLQYDLAMPLHSNDYNKVSLGALHFIPLTESFGIAVLKRTNVSTRKLMSSLLQAWPVLLFIFITAAIAGIVMWFVEKQENSKQFSRCFSHGAFDGFWWAFISMTSVGYGDKYPKSIIGRILGSSWIVLGMLFVTMFIGTLTTNLMTLLMEGTYNIKNEKISVVHGSIAHWLSTSQRANVKVVKTQKELYQSLIDQEVDAALVDINSVTDGISAVQKKHNIQVSGVLLKETFYGVALQKSSKKLTTCFEDFVEKHEDYIFDNLGKYTCTQKYELDPAEDYFGSGGIFSKSVYSMIALFFTLTIAGTLWELYKRHNINYHNKEQVTDDQETSLRVVEGHLNGRVALEPTSTASDLIFNYDQKSDELGDRVFRSKQSEV